MKKIVASLALIIALMLPGLLHADGVVEEIIARVNTQIVTRTEYLRSREQIKQELQQQSPTDADKQFAEKQRDVLRDLIDQQLLLEKGKDLGITADTELIKRLDKMRKEMKLESMEELEKAAQGQGVAFEDFKQNMRNQIITQEVISKEVGSHLSINKEDEQRFFEEHKADLNQPERVRLSEILVAPKAPPVEPSAPKLLTPNAPDPQASAPGSAPSAESEAKALAVAQAKAEDLEAQLKKSAKFEDLAKTSSDGPTAAQGGDLNYFTRGMLAKELEDKVFAMKADEISEVIRTKQGYVILKVTEHQAAGIPSLKEVEPRIQEAIYVQKLNPALRVYLTKLREDAYIDIKPGYVDTGASAAQTKPVETSVKQASAKELKKKKKLGVF